MNTGYKLLLLGHIVAIAGFILINEYPTITEGGIGALISIGSLVIIVFGALNVYQSQPS